MNTWTAVCAFFLLLTNLTLAQKCSFENCPTYKSDMLNVHLVCHTHDDSGWLKTVDQYFWGSNQDITKDGVQYILNTLFPALIRDPSKKFSYCESNFFWRWWKQQDDTTKQAVIKLVNEGQLEFIGGGWVQHDEAATHYAAMIDQMTTGHKFLNETFGRCGLPRIGWQIDPFGHSKESASLMAQMGFDALFFARIHYQDRTERWNSKSMEMIWHGSEDLGDNSNILTGVFWQHYGPPDGFCFDDGCNDDPIMDDKQLEEYNVDEKVALFIKEVNDQHQYYATNHIMLTMGSDFQYKNADQWFDNLDKLIKYVNAAQSTGSKVNVFYSTPSCYAQALRDSGYAFPEKSDDFFPYANDIHSYWTGYFTSRPALKGFVRSTNNLLQICQAMNTVAQLQSTDASEVENLHRSFGILQHHDAVSGTAKQAVTNDYQKMLYEGIMHCQNVVNDAMEYLAPKSDEVSPPQSTFCTYLNISVCSVSQNSDKFLVTIQNGLARELTTFARIPVEADDYSLTDPNGNQVQVQIVKTFFTSQITDANRSSYQVVFPVELPPFGYSTYYISKNDASKTKKSLPDAIETKKQHNFASASKCTDCTLSNNLVTVTFDSSTGLVSSVYDITSNTRSNVTQNFYWYRGTDNSMPGNQASGAYIFRPDGISPNQLSNNITLEKIGTRGDYVQEMRQTFNSWVTQIIRVYQGKPYVEFEWTVGPIPFNDGESREIISRFNSEIMNDGTFYTDANGRQIMTRQLGYQPTYQYQDDEPVAGNYYPINSRIFIKDSTKQLTILTDRSQGGASLFNGSIELMVHRRDLYDDGFGVGEPLNETGTDGRGLVVTGRHWLLLSSATNGARRHRIFAQEMFAQPLFTFSAMDDFQSYSNNFKTSFAGLTKSLPYNVNFLTLSQWQSNSNLLLRLEHLFQKDEDTELSRPVTVNLKDLFTTFDVNSMTETSLTGLELSPSTNSTRTSDFSVLLNPMEIRTFIVDVSNKHEKQKSLHRAKENPYSHD